MTDSSAASTLQPGAGPVLVVGLGKSGVSTARYLQRYGMTLNLTDSRAAPPGLAALLAELPGVDGTADVRIGGFAAARALSDYQFAVISPGTSLDEPFVAQLRAAGVPLLGDVELFARDCAQPAIGITGSNGKSTVTTLVGEMARAAGIAAGVGGNLGTPALDLLDPAQALYVLELSSFQLETTEHLRLVAATVLNISPDHLDRHGTLERYIAAKARIYAHAQTAVVNREDVATHVGSHTAQRVVSFGLDEADRGHYGCVSHHGERWLAAGDVPLLPQSALKIQGLHNVANALAALALADAAGIPRDAALRALTQFAGLPHRCEWVAEHRGVTWINDSKGTNVGATLAALQGLSGPLVWIGGGQGKGQDFSALRDPLKAKARVAIVFGQDAEAIEHDLLGAADVINVLDLQAAITVAHEWAKPGDRVLLSPACASLDQFANYEARGRAFAQQVHALIGAASASPAGEGSA